MLRKDQIVMLQELAEKLADVFIQEADPANWSGANMLPVDMDVQTRGNRHWDRKGAVGTGQVLKYTIDVANLATRPSESPNESEADEALERQIAKAQARASAAVTKLTDVSKRAGFMARAANGPT